MPLSFVCILGGTTTLIGTSTNLLVAAVAQDNGLDRFGIFTITPVGLVAGVAGTLALLLIARRFLPDDSPSQIALSQEHRTFLSEVRILKDGNLVGRRVGERYSSVTGARWSVLLSRVTATRPALPARARPLARRSIRARRLRRCRG